MESSRVVDWPVFAIGTLLGFLPWVLMFMVLSASVVEDLPWFVIAILVTYLLLFTTFPVNMILRLVGHTTLAQVEVGYAVLSLLAKSSLTWLLVAGLLRPGD